MTESTAVAAEDRFAASKAVMGVGDLPEHIRHAIEYRKLQNIAAAELSKLSWGKNMDIPTRRVIADWAAKYRVDAATEVDVLGGSAIYLNSKFYLRKLGEMVAAGLVSYAAPDFIHRDSRLDNMAAAGDAWATNELQRRAQERIKFDVDDEAVSACVFRIKLPSMDREITGCKAIYSDRQDPVGKQFPTETCESRAARRAMRHLVSHVPAFANEMIEIEDGADRVSARVTLDHQRREAEHAEHVASLALSPRGARALPPADGPIPVHIDRGDGKYEVPATVASKGPPTRSEMEQPPAALQSTDDDLELDRDILLREAQREQTEAEQSE